ncbi:MAG: hypothetical protein ACU836_04665 [Gammaproteobacteria bacterium]
MRKATVTFMACVFCISLSGIAFAAGENAPSKEPRVVVPNVPDGAKVTGCYDSIGVIYGKYNFDFCLKDRRKGSYRVRGDGIACNGRLDWDTSGPGINIRFQRTSCGRKVSWSADTAWCRPNLLLGLFNLVNESGHLSGLTCDYKPEAGSGEEAIVFGAKLVSD